MAPTIYINGRFLTQPTTGVQRFAREVVGALGSHWRTSGRQGCGSVCILVPGNAIVEQTFAHIPVRRVGYLSGHAWEQIELPWFTRDGVLVNLCNSGSVYKHCQLTVVHDAAVFSIPEAYSFAFRWWYRAMLALVARRGGELVTVSEFSRTELSRHLKIPRERLEVVLEAADHIERVKPDYEVLSRHGLTGRRFALAVSSLAPHKNFQTVVKAIDELGDLDCEFVIAGGVNPRVFAGDNVQLSPRVKYIGYVSDAELRALYDAALCLIYPSKYEGFGLPPLEAMMCGCPVIVANAASLPEVCGTAAMYCDPSEPSDIARRVRELLFDEALLRDLKVRGRSRAKMFSWARTADQLASLVDKVSQQCTRQQTNG